MCGLGGVGATVGVNVFGVSTAGTVGSKTAVAIGFGNNLFETLLVGDGGIGLDNIDGGVGCWIYVRGRGGGVIGTRGEYSLFSADLKRNVNFSPFSSTTEGPFKNSSSSGSSTFSSTDALVTGSDQSSSPAIPASTSLADPSPSISGSASPANSLKRVNPLFRLFVLSARVSTTSEVQSESNIDHKPKSIRSNNGVVGGGNLTVDIVGLGLLLLLSFLGVGGRFDNREGPGMEPSNSDSEVGVEGAGLGVGGKRYDAR